MARNDPQVNFRIPADLNERIKASAAENNRTITAELVHRLEASFDDTKLSLQQVEQVMKLLLSRIDPSWPPKAGQKVSGEVSLDHLNEGKD